MGKLRIAMLHLATRLGDLEHNRRLLDPLTDKLHNTVFVLGPDGGQLGTSRKTQVVPVAETSFEGTAR